MVEAGASTKRQELLKVQTRHALSQPLKLKDKEKGEL